MASFLLLSLFALAEIAQSQTPTPTPGTCYTPQGVPIPGQQACNAYLQVSSCCPKGATCFSNQLCILTDPDEVGNGLSLGAVLRGGCTNPLWSNSICGSFCLGAQLLLRTFSHANESFKAMEMMVSYRLAETSSTVVNRA